MTAWFLVEINVRPCHVTSGIALMNDQQLSSFYNAYLNHKSCISKLLYIIKIYMCISYHLQHLKRHRQLKSFHMEDKNLEPIAI